MYAQRLTNHAQHLLNSLVVVARVRSLLEGAHRWHDPVVQPDRRRQVAEHVLLAVYHGQFDQRGATRTKDGRGKALAMRSDDRARLAELFNLRATSAPTNSSQRAPPRASASR